MLNISFTVKRGRKNSTYLYPQSLFCPPSALNATKNSLHMKASGKPRSRWWGLSQGTLFGYRIPVPEACMGKSQPSLSKNQDTM